MTKWRVEREPGPVATMLILYNGPDDEVGRVVARTYGPSQRLLALALQKVMQLKLATGEWPNIEPSTREEEEEESDGREA